MSALIVKDNKALDYEVRYDGYKLKHFLTAALPLYFEESKRGDGKYPVFRSEGKYKNCIILNLVDDEFYLLKYILKLFASNQPKKVIESEFSNAVEYSPLVTTSSKNRIFLDRQQKTLEFIFTNDNKLKIKISDHEKEIEITLNRFECDKFLDKIEKENQIVTIQFSIASLLGSVNSRGKINREKTSDRSFVDF